jgi:uncharacterized protein (TIGR02679 family)
MSTPSGPPAETASLDNLSAAEIVDEQTIRRIRAVLGGTSWEWLTHVVRTAWEKDLSRRRVRVDLSTLSDSEAAAMADFFSWPTHRTGPISISLPRLDALLRASGLSAGLATCLTAASGPLRDDAGRRRADKAAREAASDQLWAEAAAHPAIVRHPSLNAWLADERRTGRLPAAAPVRRQVVFDALAVLDALPDPGTGLARLASRALGHAHALDDGPVQAAVLRALAWLDERPLAQVGSARRRMLWASAGVALDTVSSTVLVLNLILPGNGPASSTLAANAAAGLPARLTLGQVRHYLDAERSPSASTPVSVFVCENPTVVEAAADSLGAGTAPLVCVEGRPSVAAILLLQEMRDAGSELRYHGDFDWPGLAIARTVMGIGAVPWRLGAADYGDGLTFSRRLKRLPSPIGEVQTPWDQGLALTMLDHLTVVEEETVIDYLLADLTVDS